MHTTLSVNGRTNAPYGAQEIQTQISINTIVAFRSLLFVLLCSIPLIIIYKKLEPYIFPSPTVAHVLLTQVSESTVPYLLIELDVRVPRDVLKSSKPHQKNSDSKAATTYTSMQPEIGKTPEVLAESMNLENIDVYVNNLPYGTNNNGLGNDPNSQNIDPDGSGGIHSSGSEEIADSSDHTIFIPNEIDAQFSYDAIHKLITYPENALRLGIEGTVVVDVFVGSNGSALRTKIIQSDNSMLDNAALDAVRKSSYSPAIQNKQPVPSWIQIPISFKLK